MEENGTRSTDGAQTAADRAADTSTPLLDAATKVGNAYLDACQETVLCIEDFCEKVAETTPMDWSQLVAQPGLPGNIPLGEQWLNALGQPGNANDLVEPGKRVCLACVDAYERAALRTIDLRERVAGVTNVDWIRSIAASRAALARDATKAYSSLARRFLQSA
jgi:hypothetical protein